MDLELKDKVAIVGGASMGIGYGIARTLAAEGARVAVTARREPALARAAEAIARETGVEVLPVQADCRRAEDCARVIDTVSERLGGIDILVNNDGAPPLGDLQSFDDAAWSKAIEQNLMYVVRMARGALPHMISRGGGSILDVIRNPELAAEYLRAALEDDDEPSVLLIALRRIAKAQGGIAKVAKAAGIERESLYRATARLGTIRPALVAT